MRNITALLIALLLAASCSSAPSASSALSGQPTTPALNAPSTPTPPCASLPFEWQRRLPGRVQSFTLASKAPGGGWVTHSTHPPDARFFTIDNLASGQHSFQVMVAYDNGQGQIFGLGSVSIAESSCLLIELSPSTTPVPPTTVPPPPTTTPPLGTVSLAAVPACEAVTIHWAPGSTHGLKSFVLASKAPGGGWIASTHAPSARTLTVDGLGNGQHSFQILAVYDDGWTRVSNVSEATVYDCTTTSTTEVPTTSTGSDSELRRPGSGVFTEADAEVLIGLPWREAQEMAHAVGWHTQVIFTVEGEMFPMSTDLSLGRLRLIVVGGEEAGTVKNVNNS
jgi:hypothetical protein